MQHFDEKKPNNKLNSILIKLAFALIIAFFCVIILFVLGDNDSLETKIIAFIIYFLLLVFLLFEFIRIFPLPKWVRFYLPLLSFIPFFCPWEELLNWFLGKNDLYSLNLLINSQYQYKMFGIPGIGYLIQAILVAIPFFFCKKQLIDVIKYYLVTYLIFLILTITSKSFMYTNIENIYFIFFLIIGPIICDSFAYLGGILFGNKIFKNKKLAPKISPNKTIEGAITGFLFTWLILFLILWFIHFKYLNVDDITLVIVLPIFIPITSIIGDLIFSAIKRMLKIKDYSNLIPGHGGLLDRLDSIIITSFIFLPLFIVG